MRGRIVSSVELAKMLRDSGLDVRSLSLEKAVKYYEGIRRLEWDRVRGIAEVMRTLNELPDC